MSGFNRSSFNTTPLNTGEAAQVSLAGVVSAAAVVAGGLTEIPGTVEAKGTVYGNTAVAGALCSQRSLAGSISAQSGASGYFEDTGVVFIKGEATAVSGISGGLQHLIAGLSGRVEAQSSVRLVLFTVPLWTRVIEPPAAWARI